MASVFYTKIAIYPIFHLLKGGTIDRIHVSIPQKNNPDIIRGIRAESLYPPCIITRIRAPKLQKLPNMGLRFRV